MKLKKLSKNRFIKMKRLLFIMIDNKIHLSMTQKKI